MTFNTHHFRNAGLNGESHGQRQWLQNCMAQLPLDAGGGARQTVTAAVPSCLSLSPPTKTQASLFLCCCCCFFLSVQHRSRCLILEGSCERCHGGMGPYISINPVERLFFAGGCGFYFECRGANELTEAVVQSGTLSM